MCGSKVNVKISIIALIAISVVVRHFDAKRTRRIIGGTNAEADEFPWMARIYLSDIHGSRSQCGGAIISSRHILTSASCLEGCFVSSIWVGSDYSFCLRFILHPHYSSNYSINNELRFYNDVGIVVLYKDLQEGKNWKAISLANTKTAVGTTALLSSWGLTGRPEKDRFMILQKTPINIVPEDECPIPTENELCGQTIPNAALYYGDAGSPLVVDGRLVGILSNVWLIPGAKSIYTDVYYHRNWIMYFAKNYVKNIAGRKNF